MEQLYYRYNPWWEKDRAFTDTISRPQVFSVLRDNLDNQSIIMLTGLRRVGKTTIMKQVIEYLITEKKVDPKHVFYVSLDDYLLSSKSIIEIVEDYRKVQQLSVSDKIYLFLDEVAGKNDFEIQLKNLYDKGNSKIFTSASSASILKSKKAYLTGRNIVIEILPLDFDEYLRFKQITISKADEYLREGYFEEFMQTGGIPEFVMTGNIEYLKELVDDIIQKDIAAYYGIKDIQGLKDFFLLLMERSGKIFSINKIAKVLEIAPDTAKRYLQMFADSYLIFLLPRHGKTNERLLSAKKIYAADLGIRVLFTGFRDKGSLFENYVYLLIRHNKPAYLYQDGNEIDFLTQDQVLIEVKYNSQMSAGQDKLFDLFKAKEKILISNIADLNKLQKLK